jgi:hypothetical protein
LWTTSEVLKAEASGMIRKTAEEWLDRALELGVLGEEGFASTVPEGASALLFTDSVQRRESESFAMLRIGDGRALGVFGLNNSGFDGKLIQKRDIKLRFCPLTHANAARIRSALPFTAPARLSGVSATIGLGDRLGIASPGHLRLFKEIAGGSRLAPVLAQQSVRELNLSGRNYRAVLDAATWAVFQEGYTEVWGADGDHLKSPAWVVRALREGYTMITADVSDSIHGEYADRDGPDILEAYGRLDRRKRAMWEQRYLPLAMKLDTGEVITFEREELARIALIYGEAVEHAARLYRAGVKVRKEFDFELSIDETETPTLPAAHLFVAMEMKNRGIPVASLAPRFVGEFQKGIDYIGDQDRFGETLRIHAALARHFGYRLSIHSGSDKFAVFPIIGRHTLGRFHLKTAGTNWLQALLVLARREPAFFRTLYSIALERYPKARRYYHITPRLEDLPDPSSVKDGELPGLLDVPDARQVLHISYGEILQNREVKRRLYEHLTRHMEGYWSSLMDHIGKHLELLGLSGSLEEGTP